MRRLSAILMIAALLAAVVPSATSAGKPVPVIGNTSVVSGGVVDGQCTVNPEPDHPSRSAPRAFVTSASCRKR